MAECRWHFGYLPLVYELDLKRMNFLHKLLLVDHSPAHLMMTLFGNDDLRVIFSKYNIDVEAGLTKRKRAVWDAFYFSLNSS